ncbi:RNA polymerase sigma factor [Kineosporia sp. NBRC 101731]|nr:RNA polymerase sigma factor [Kineosporia sp. NBRC 101731]
MTDVPEEFAAPQGATRPGSDRIDILARAAAAGDDAALNDLLAAIQPEVLRRTGKMLPHREDAEEAAQDALLQVARRISSFEGRSSFRTWLYVVVSNAARQTYRDLKRRAGEQPLTVEEQVRPDPRRTSVIAGSRIDLLEALESLESSHPQLVLPFVYRDLADLEYEEIARRLDLPLGTVKSRLNQARQEVRRRLVR